MVFKAIKLWLLKRSNAARNVRAEAMHEHAMKLMEESGDLLQMKAAAAMRAESEQQKVADEARIKAEQSLKEFLRDFPEGEDELD